MGVAGGTGGGEMETTVLEPQQKMWKQRSPILFTGTKKLLSFVYYQIIYIFPLSISLAFILLTSWKEYLSPAQQSDAISMPVVNSYPCV